MGTIVSDVAAIIDASEFYLPEHRLIFQAILRLYAKEEPVNYLAVADRTPERRRL